MSAVSPAGMGGGIKKGESTGLLELIKNHREIAC
jgi:hypothetical protein